MTTIERLEKELAEAKEGTRKEKRAKEIKEAKQHVYPEKFPFKVDDMDEVVMGHFVQGPCDEEGDSIWDDYAEARRRWELYPAAEAERRSLLETVKELNRRLRL